MRPRRLIRERDPDHQIRPGYGDALTLAQRPPHPGQYRREICDGVSAGLDTETGEIESLEIRRFKALVEQDGEIVLPINATLRPIKQSVAAE